MDVFFDREYSSNGINIAHVRDSFKNITLQLDNKNMEEKIESLHALIKEKDERIALLIRLNEIYSERNTPSSGDGR